jgi:integrase
MRVRMLAEDRATEEKRKAEGVLKRLKYQTFLEAIKQTAEDMGFDPAQFGTHSLRSGALTQLGAGGVPLEEVQRYARHRSAVSTAHYQQTSIAERDRAAKVLSSDLIFGMRDVRVLSRTDGSAAAKDLAF